MIRHALRTGILGVMAASMVGCGAAPTVTNGTAAAPPAAASSDVPLVEIPMQAAEVDLVAPQTMGAYDTQQWRGGRRFRFRRVFIRRVPYYVPYYYPTPYSSYIPYYTHYDPYYYYTPAYATPYFGGRSIVVRYGRRRGGRRR